MTTSGAMKLQNMLGCLVTAKLLRLQLTLQNKHQYAQLCSCGCAFEARNTQDSIIV
jgi:hypothetical protein